MLEEQENLKYLSIAVTAAKRAGRFLFNNRFKSIINSESRWDIKTDADLKAERIIIEFLNKESDFAVLSEESGSIEGADKQYVWIVDPLDGTLNYMRGIPVCGVSIALWKKKQPVLGVIYDFNHNELFSGIAHKGSRLNGKIIKPSNIVKNELAVLCTGFPINSDLTAKGLFEFSKEISRYKKTRLLGSAALSICYVACGRADIYRENNILLWDVAAGLAIAEGSGCARHIRAGSKSGLYDITVTNGNLK